MISSVGSGVASAVGATGGGKASGRRYGCGGCGSAARDEQFLAPIETTIRANAIGCCQGLQSHAKFFGNAEKGIARLYSYRSLERLSLQELRLPSLLQLARRLFLPMPL